MKTNGRYATVLALLGVALLAANASATLVANWRFDGDLTDSSGFGHNGTFYGSGSPTYTTNGGHAFLSLNGVDQYVRVAAEGSNLDIESGSFSIVAWLQMNPVDNTRREDWIAARPSGYALTADYNNLTGTGNQSFTGRGYPGSVTAAFQGSSYVMLTIVRDDSIGKITSYTNGVAYAQVTSAGSFASASDLFIGSSGLGPWLEIDLDLLHIYNDALIQSEITTLYNNGNGPEPLLVPEPSVISLAVLAGLSWWWRRMNRG